MSQVRNTVERRLPKKLTESQNLSREEWDFEGVPDDWKPYCAKYEYQREEIQLEIKKNTKLSLHIKPPTPYQTSPEKQQLQKLTSKDWENISGIPKCREEWGRAIKETFRLKEDGQSIFPEIIPFLNRSVECVALKIDWSKADDEIKKEFAAWLKYRRRIEPEKQTGKSEIRTAKKYLKALGAYRLLQNMTIDQAIEFTQMKSGNMKPLFANSSDWSNANKLARERLGISNK